MGGDKLYVYGVVEAETLSIPVDGVNGASEAYTVEHRAHAALVSDVETMDPERTDGNVEAHDDVLRTAMNHGEGRTVVPMRFGMVFESERALKHVLRSGRRAFSKALREVDGKVELGVKVVAPEEGTEERDEIRGAVEGELDPLSVRVSEEDEFSDRLVLNRSYLVERSRRGAFDEAIDRLRDATPGVTLRYTGPWAPYSFVDIEIGVAQ